MATLTLRTEHATLDELEGALASRVADDVVFLPAPCDAPVGARVVVEVALASGDVALSFEGHVRWRYRADALPPGREAGVGVVVEEASDEARELFSRLRAREGSGADVRAPGATLAASTQEPGWLRAPRAPALVEEARASAATEAPVDVTLFAARTPEEVLAEHQRHLEETSARADVRPLPSPPAADVALPPRPDLFGVFVVYEDDRGRAGGVKHLERFSWPEVGTQRPSETDSRFKPPGDTDDDGPSPWDEITDGQRAAPRWEVSDPGSPVTDFVGRALDDMADVDRALDASPRQPPAPPSDSVDDNAETPVEGQLPAGLRMRVDHGAVEPLFAAGSNVPASRTVTLSPSNGHQSVKVAVFEGERAGHGRHLGTVRVRVPNGEHTTSVRFDVRADGFLEVRSLDDGSVAERWRTSWAGPADYPRAEERRGGWRRWFRW